MIFAILIGFIIGLQATLHCVGMCGPLALAAPIDRSRKSTAIWSSITYNLGRITTYTYLGLLIGLFGLSKVWLNAIQVLSVLAGLFFIATVVYGSLETWGPLRLITHEIGRLNTRLFPEIKKMPSAMRPFLFGLLNGLLPCGMVYLALIYTLSSSHINESALRMLFFGLGTLPVMLFIPLIGQDRFFQLFPKNTQKILMLLIGLLLVLRGLGLGIPYLSPTIQLATTPNALPSMKCCEVQK